MATQEIKVKIGAETDGLDKGMSKAEASLAKFAKVGAASVVAVGAAMIALTKASMDNIDVLAKQARSLGLTTSAFQKMALVAGEAGIESGKLSSMLGLMQRNIVELSNGTQAQVDSFNALGVSLADLQGLSPDEQFSKIADALSAVGDPAEKTALSMEVFGRAGRDAINMLSGYSEAAANAAEFQNRFGIAVTQATSDNVERANDAVGRLGMVMEGLGNTMAGAVAPAIEATANALIQFTADVLGAKVTLEEFFGTLDDAKSILGEDIFNKLFNNPEAIVKYRDELDAIAAILPNLSSDLGDTANQMRAMGSSLALVGQTDAAGKMLALAQELFDVRKGFDEGTISADAFKAKIVDIDLRSQSLVESLGSVDGAQFSGVISRIGGITSALQSAINKSVELLNTIPGAGGGDFIGPVQQPSGTGYNSSGRGSINPDATDAMIAGLSSGNLMTSQTGGTAGATGAGGGGGISSADKVREDMAARLEALMEGMMTEQETVAEWYETNRMLLEEARAAELLTETEFMTQKERLEKEHQDRLSKIKQMGAAANLSLALGAGAEILNAIGTTNKKALKIAKVFGAAEALVNTYQGASKEIAKGGWSGFAKAAAVVAKGIGFVNAIRSVNDSGGGGGSVGGGGGGGGGSSAAAAPAQAPATTFAFTLQNDPMGFGESFARQMIEQLNQTQRNGGQIRGVLA